MLQHPVVSRAPRPRALVAGLAVALACTSPGPAVLPSHTIDGRVLRAQPPVTVYVFP